MPNDDLKKRTKLCPLEQRSGFTRDCIKNRCAWWTNAYTTEGIEVFDCAVVINAMKDSNGRIPV